MSDAEGTTTESEGRGAVSPFDCDACLPAEAFAVVGNETRFAILKALWEAPDRPVTFLALRDRVGVRDSAQFNYHLQKLTGQFVRKTDDGYDFQSAGRAVIQAVLSGSLNQDPEFGPFPVEGECIDCGTGLQAHYEEELLYVGCPACGRAHTDWQFPPGGLEGRDREAVMDAFNQRVRHLLCLSADGVCPACNGRMQTDIAHADAADNIDVAVTHRCRRCENTTKTTVGIALLDDAEVVSFYRDHGIDLNSVPFWTLEWCVSDRHTEIVDDDPWRVAVEIPLDDERLSVVLDESLSVAEAERSHA